MIQGLIGKKVGMTHLFGPGGETIPVTVLEVGPCVVTQVRTEARDGYQAVQIGFGRAKQLTQPARGHLRAAGAESKVLHEFSATSVSEHEVGESLAVTQFQPGDWVDVAGKTKGRGFQGAMKRYGFSGGPRTHGQGDRGRATGSIGAGTYPGRVYKGKKMPGHMGNRQVTARKLLIARIDPERNLLMVRGAVPGSRNTVVTVSYAKGVAVAGRLSEEEWAALLGSDVAVAEASAENPEVEAVAAEEAAVEEETPAAEEPASEPEADGTGGKEDEQRQQ
jgi:large subunit ribosomal protein L3